MDKLATKWTGQLFGTNTGNLFIEFYDTPNINVLSGVLRINDYNFGLSIYNISGRLEESSKLKITGTPVSIESTNKIALGNLTVEAELFQDGSLKGEWETTINTAGIFIAFAFPDSTPVSTPETSNIPEQIYTKNISLGAIRLFLKDIEQFLKDIKKDFSGGRIIVTYNNSTNQIMQFSEVFLKATHPETLNYLKINIQEPAGIHGINKIVLVELGANGTNNIQVQGVDESWVIGKAEKLAFTLKSHQNFIRTVYKKFGLSINGIIFFAMLAATPSIDTLLKRAIFVASIFIVLVGLFQLHTHFVPIAAIKMSDKKPGWLFRNSPSIFSWVASIIATLIGSLLYYWLTKTPPSN